MTDRKQKVLVTGAAGFIGFHITKRLLENGDKVIGIDNINDYYDVNLKYSRLIESGISIDIDNEDSTKIYQSDIYPHYQFIKMDIENKEQLNDLFLKEKIDKVCHLAAQVGVRYSLENPYAYINSNIFGFINIIEACRQFDIKHLIYASSSSVYGDNTEMPLKTSSNVDHPISLYAATKKSNELIAHTYSHLYELPTTGLRFFTVYGPWGRPDMAYYIFTKQILEEKPIKVFNEGKMLRDFTYIDDIVEGIRKVIERPTAINKGVSYKIYNIGNSSPVLLLDFIKEIENALGKKAIKEFLPMQPGDVLNTKADVSGLIKDMGYKPNTPIETGVREFIEWYQKYHV